MNDKTIIEWQRKADRNAEILQRRLDEVSNAAQKLAALAGRKALEDECFRRAQSALYADAAGRHDAWASLPWWRRLFRRPPALSVPHEQIADLASRLREAEVTAARVRRDAAAQAEADAAKQQASDPEPNVAQPEKPRLRAVPPPELG